MLVVVMEDSKGPASSHEDPLTNLRARLKRLRRHAGEPSTRDISRLTSNAISHTTVSLVLRCAKLPRWGPLELVVEALQGDIDEFRSLWIMVLDTADGLQPAMPSPTHSQGPADKAGRIPSLRGQDNDLQGQRDESPVRRDQTALTYEQVMINRQARNGFDNPESYSERTIVAIEIIDLNGMKSQFGQIIWLQNLDLLYTTVNKIVTEADPNVVVNYFDNMMMLVFDVDMTVQALNAAIKIQEVLTSGEIGDVDVHCSIGITSGEVIEFTAQNTNLLFLGATVDLALGLCAAGSANAIFIHTSTAMVTNMVRIRSQVGRALGRGTSGYQGELERIMLKRFNQPIEYYEILWDQQLYGVKFAMVTENSANTGHRN